MKTIRTWVYALLKYNEDIIVIKKKRWPFSWLYDLPGGKIEHFENHILSLKREIKEEVWLDENEFEIEKILAVKEDFVNHIWEWKEKEEHIIAIVYEVKVLVKKINLNFIENWWDSAWLKIISIKDKILPKTNILKEIINFYKRNYY